MTPLYGYNSQESSFLVDNYPYGGMRCRIKFWLEADPKKGFRFVSCTENPKTLRWNTPKKSTYSLLAGNMYLDERGHCTWDGITEYSEASKVLQFLNDFPNTDTTRLNTWCKQKRLYVQARLDGKINWRVAGAVVSDTEDEKEKMRAELKIWQECSARII